MMKRIIYTDADGGVSVVVPTPQALTLMTVEEIQAKDVPDGTPSEIVEHTELPQDRTFRDAWERSGVVVAPELEKARVISHWHRRNMRKQNYAPHDAVVALNIPGEDHNAAEAERVIIRDADALTQIDIDVATDVDALLALTEPLVTEDMK